MKKKIKTEVVDDTPETLASYLARNTPVRCKCSVAGVEFKGPNLVCRDCGYIFE
jgi:hypothetical protein